MLMIFCRVIDKIDCIFILFNILFYLVRNSCYLFVEKNVNRVFWFIFCKGLNYEVLLDYFYYIIYFL